jgi:hypothetical protein
MYPRGNDSQRLPPLGAVNRGDPATADKGEDMVATTDLDVSALNTSPEARVAIAEYPLRQCRLRSFARLCVGGLCRGPVDTPAAQDSSAVVEGSGTSDVLLLFKTGLRYTTKCKRKCS